MTGGCSRGKASDQNDLVARGQNLGSIPEHGGSSIDRSQLLAADARGSQIFDKMSCDTAHTWGLCDALFGESDSASAAHGMQLSICPMATVSYLKLRRPVMHVVFDHLHMVHELFVKVDSLLVKLLP